MIRYALSCPDAHAFDSWFPSAAAYEDQRARGLVACPVCGSTQVDKVLMAPAVRPARKAAGAAPDLSQPGSKLEEAMTAFRKQIEANSDYVGVNFVAEARKMHAGEVPERSIHGEAKPEEARKLLEDGIPVAPLPFLPARKVN